MSKRRAKILLAVVWSLSFLICFPPLVGWNDRQAERGTSALTGREHCANWSCELTNDAGYVVYSALGSFFLPMLVMLFFYWRIYRAAVETTKAINQGFRTTKVPCRTHRTLQHWLPQLVGRDPPLLGLVPLCPKVIEWLASKNERSCLVICATFSPFRTKTWRRHQQWGCPCQRFPGLKLHSLFTVTPFSYTPKTKAALI